MCLVVVYYKLVCGHIVRNGTVVGRQFLVDYGRVVAREYDSTVIHKVNTVPVFFTVAGRLVIGHWVAVDDIG